VAGSLALVSGLALFSVAHAPGAVGQLASVGVGNDGGATASTGGNNATGNSSTNNINSTATGGGLLGGVVDANVGLGSPTNTSTGTATVNSGPATASGNQSQTGVNQSNSGGTNSTFSPFGSTSGNNQSATVTNSGTASATTGGNTAVGNDSQNTIGSTANVGLVAADVGLGAPINNSTGSAAIATGPASAVGNTAGTAVNQTRTTDSGGGSGLGAGGGPAFFGGPGFVNATPFLPGTFPGTVSGFGSSFDPCSGRFFPFNPFANDPSGQRVSSTNNAVVNQTASGGLIGLNVNLGSPTNNSTGTAAINTGAANASGNQSTTTVNQACGEGAGTGGSVRNPITGIPIVVSAIPAAPIVVHPGVTTTLARTGFESGMIVAAAALVLFGLALLISARRRLTPAGFGGTVSSAEWESVVRW